MQITKTCKSSGTGIFTRIYRITEVVVKITDEYNFDEYRNGMGPNNVLNNVGRDMQIAGWLKEFEWETTFCKTYKGW